MKWIDIDQQKVIDIYQKPTTAIETAKICNISLYFVNKILKENNIALHDSETTKRLTAEAEQKVFEQKYGVGVHSPFSVKSVQEKSKQTCLEKYGVDNYAKTDECVEKMRQTNLEVRGVEFPMQSDEVKAKSEETKQELYGDPHFTNREKSKQTSLEVYGTEYPAQSDKVKEKVKQTCLEKYNSTAFFGSEQWKQNDTTHTPDCIQRQVQTRIQLYGSANNVNKILATKEKNNTFNVSNSEEQFKAILIERFGPADVFTQYLDKQRYPFHCDFYIKSEDLFIELNLTWTHGLHPFDSANPEDNAKLAIWQQKAEQSNYYRNAIETWTERDVLKIKTAEVNKLNYKAFYTLEEALEFLNTNEWGKK